MNLSQPSVCVLVLHVHAVHCTLLLYCMDHCLTHTHTHTHTHNSHAHAHTPTQTHEHMRTHAHNHAYIHTHTYTHIHTHTLTHTHTHTHTHTQIWPHKEYPLIPVGKMVLDRNPKNYFAEVEQMAFEPSNMPPGIEISPDKMLQVCVCVCMGRGMSLKGHSCGSVFMKLARISTREGSLEGSECIRRVCLKWAK